ncbi:MAG: ABC-type transport auxiliary lipoprotein family protein [Gammaproteobacteria bacterium]
MTAVVLLNACSILPKPAPVAINQYLFEYASASQAERKITTDAPVIVIAVPRAYAGYDSTRIAYKREDYGLRYYTLSRWADTPARMLAPLLAAAVQATGQFHALYATPGLVAADLRLDTELVRFYQDFRSTPSEIRITLRARLIDHDKGRVIASWLVDRTTPAESDDAYGGVVAANRLLGQVLDELARFCASVRP